MLYLYTCISIYLYTCISVYVQEQAGKMLPSRMQEMLTVLTPQLRRRSCDVVWNQMLVHGSDQKKNVSKGQQK
jgi:hypothetical protein